MTSRAATQRQTTGHGAGGRPSATRTGGRDAERGWNGVPTTDSTRPGPRQGRAPGDRTPAASAARSLFGGEAPDNDGGERRSGPGRPGRDAANHPRERGRAAGRPTTSASAFQLCWEASARSGGSVERNGSGQRRRSRASEEAARGLQHPRAAAPREGASSGRARASRSPAPQVVQALPSRDATDPKRGWPWRQGPVSSGENPVGYEAAPSWAWTLDNSPRRMRRTVPSTHAARAQGAPRAAATTRCGQPQREAAAGRVHPHGRTLRSREAARSGRETPATRTRRGERGGSSDEQQTNDERGERKA